MKTHHPILAICAGTVIFAAAGCGKADTSPMPTVAPQTQDAQATASQPTPALPAPNAPRSAAGSDPKPGDAGDHSSAAFKDGGKPVSSR